MAQAPRLSFRLPPDMLAELTRRAESRGVTVGRCVVEALSVHLRMPVDIEEWRVGRPKSQTDTKSQNGTRKSRNGTKQAKRPRRD